VSDANVYLSEYINQVLGVQSFLQSLEPAFESSQTPKLLFLVDAPLSKPAQELFGKMVQAMKLENTDFRLEVGPVSVESETQPMWTISFSERFSPQGKGGWTQTLSPEILLHQPEHKRRVWQDLQAVMKALK
jgi:hypothetical protein